MRKFITCSDRIVPVHHPRVVFETALFMGAPERDLLENTELTRQMLGSAEMRISHRQYGILCRNALRITGNAALGLDVGRNLGIGQMGALGFLMQNAPTLGTALEAALHYTSALAPGWQLQLERAGATSAITFSETLPLGSLRAFAHEILLASFDAHARFLSGRRPIPFRSFQLPFEEPPHASRYHELFGGAPAVFGRDVARLEFESSILDAAIPFADPATLQIAEQICVQRLVRESTEEGLLEQVRRLVSTDPGDPPSLGAIAQVLQTSTRTLRRELGRQQTSYKQLIDEVRRARAEEWLASNSMPLGRLARGLGFASTSSFRRAYKRWTGRTPGAARQRC